MWADRLQIHPAREVCTCEERYYAPVWVAHWKLGMGDKLAAVRGKKELNDREQEHLALFRAGALAEVDRLSLMLEDWHGWVPGSDRPTQFG